MECVVCKQPIKDEPYVDTPQGPVHQGQCHNHLSEMPVTESAESLNEVQLLV